MPQKYLNTRLIKIFLASCLCLIIVFFNFGRTKSVFQSAFIWTAYPFQKTAAFFGEQASQIAYFLSSISDLKRDNENLLKENHSLSAKIALLESQQKENEELKKELKLLPKEKFELSGAYVIAQNSDNSGNWILIDKGSSDGIAKNMPVIVYEGILIGKVEEVFQNSSKINLLSSALSSVNAFDLETGARGVVRGEYGLGIILDIVDQSDALNQGDIVATSGLGGNVPRGLLIGSIQEVRNSSDKLFQQAIITPRIKYSDLEIIFVVKNEK